MMGSTSWRFTTVDSTQNVAFHLAELGAPHGTVVRADHQTAGRGRQGRSWRSASGSALMFSVLLRPEQPLHLLGSVSVLVADVLAEIVSTHVTDPVQIKWPNDVLIAGRKVSGILLQTRSTPSAVAVLGIGINLNTSPDELPESATSVNQHTHRNVQIEELYAELLVGLDRMWNELLPVLNDNQIARLESRLWRRGEHVSLLDANREMRGQIAGIAPSGGLKLLIDGAEREIVAGEITRGPRPIDSGEAN